MLEVNVHEAQGALPVTALDGVGNLEVIGVRTGHRARRFIKRDDERGAGDEFGEEFGQHRIAREAGDLAMEIA